MTNTLRRRAFGLGACDVARLEHVLDDAQLDAVALALDLFRLSDRLRAAAHVRLVIFNAPSARR